MKRIVIILYFIIFFPVIAIAHPISQGALDVELLPNNVHVRARVPSEEIFVANAFSATANKAATLEDTLRDHGSYFLQHFQIAADNHVLTGAMTYWAEEGSSHVIYEFDYPVSAIPSQLSFRQNLLNEFLFSPGNPWEATFVVKIREQGQLRHEGLLLTSKQALNVSNTTTMTGEDRQKMFGDYLRHGVTHILTGYDHLLFITALVLATVTAWDLIRVVTAFTLAHTITLTLSVLGIVRLSSAVVEPMIAASIVLVAASNVIWPHRSRGWLRLMMAFFFGLFHGLGFAGGLLDAMEGMSGIAVSMAIVAFSLGVELGHQMVVLPVFAGLRLVRSRCPDEPSRNRLSLIIMRVGSLLICVAGTVYLVAALK